MMASAPSLVLLAEKEGLVLDLAHGSDALVPVLAIGSPLSAAAPLTVEIDGSVNQVTLQS